MDSTNLQHSSWEIWNDAETVSERTQIGKISVFTDEWEVDRASECSRSGSQRTGRGIDETDVKTVGGHRGIKE